MTKARLSPVTFRTLAHLSGAGQSTRDFLKRQLWAWPLLATLVLGLIGWWVNWSVEDAIKQQMADELTTLLHADTAALELWLRATQADAEALALDLQVRVAARELIALTATDPRPEGVLLTSGALPELRLCLLPRLEAQGYDDFVLVDRQGRVLAARDDRALGVPLSGYQREFLQKVLEEGASVSQPFASSLLLADAQGAYRAGVPTMFAAAVVRAADGQAIAVLGLRLKPEEEFTRILQVARWGRSGETYAFDRRGLLLSSSRFDDELKRIGLLADGADSHSILTLVLRDPLVNRVEGQQTPRDQGELPLTHMAAAAISGTTGQNVDGYRDYRGVPVIGAWTWLPKYDFGVATEVDVAEAFQPLYILRRTFRGLLALLALSAVAIFLFMIVVARQQRALLTAVLTAKQLGQYTLEEKIGSGGMGSVYRARHAMLRRPTAVKLLDIERISDAAIVRFEREVQLTSQLTHPNTIAIYDYGSTPEGVFYYAMEYLDGINLEDLVQRYGPVPDGRVVAILQQVCGSLAEAHDAGLIHRDIKPANILLTRRGGLYDFVTVLDFGLVKAVGDASLTAVGSVAGTPLYLSPEAIEGKETVDLRSDLYAVGAVGYFLLTGTPVFPGPSVVDLCVQHVSTIPEPPTHRLGRAISPRLDALILRCLAKDRDGRPAGAELMAEELARCDVVAPWTRADAEVWWRAAKTPLHQASVAPPSEVLTGATTDVIAEPQQAPEPAPRRPEPTTIVQPPHPTGPRPAPTTSAQRRPEPSTATELPHPAGPAAGTDAPRPTERRPELSTITNLPCPPNP